MVQNKPMYVGPEYIASSYGTVYKLITTQPLKLLDIRKLKNIVRLIITSRKSNDSKILQCIRYLTIAFGLCSYSVQIKLLEEYIKDVKNLVEDKEQLASVIDKINIMKYTDTRNILNPLDPEGVRVAETYIDGHVMILLRDLFDDIYDGFIAPKMFSPFHLSDKSHEEIVIFNPIKSGIKLLKKKYKNSQIEKIHISTLLHKSYIIKDTNNFFNRKVYIGGLLKENDRNDFFLNKTYIKNAEKLSKYFCKNVNIQSCKLKNNLVFNKLIPSGILADC
jgi:hypothetical protein